MARLRFKNFSDLAFIQAIDKPKYIRPLLEPHRDFFARQGIDIANLRNTDATDRQLLQVFTQPDETMPADLLETLYVLDDLADESGHDRIQHEAERQGLSVDGDGMTAGEFAIAAHRGHPELVRVCHEKTLYRKVKNYQEYQARTNARLSLATVEKRLKQLKSMLGPWFESKDRSPACEIHAYGEDAEVRFLITHGRLLRTDGSFDKRLRRSRVAYRPQKHDSVIYDNRLSVLRVNAQTQAEKSLYRDAFGRVLFDDADHFPGDDLYTLAPLKRGTAAMRLVPGIESVRLTEVWIQIDNDQRFVQISKAYNLAESIAGYGRPNLAEGRLQRASFLLKYSSGGKARKLELRPPNIAIYDRDRDGVPAESFMRANGYIKIGRASGDARS